MSKAVIVVIPDNYNRSNVIERIKGEFNNDPKIFVSNGEAMEAKLGDIIRAVGDFQSELKRIERES